jgi:hypothetical protein
MKLTTTFLLLLICSVAFAQDSILTFAGKRIAAEIVSTAGDTIRYKKSDSKKPTQYTITKNLVSGIKHGNGSTEDFFTEAEKNIPLEDLKSQIVTAISASAFEVDSNTLNYRPVFDGNLMKMPIYNKKNKLDHPGFQWDFTKVYEFQPVSERNDTDAYLNIIAVFQEKPGKSKWVKQKLVLRIKGHKQAHEIQRLLQVFNYRLSHKTS